MTSPLHKLAWRTHTTGMTTPAETSFPDEKSMLAPLERAAVELFVGQRETWVVLDEHGHAFVVWVEDMLLLPPG